jgi:hypothetical protein
METFLPNDYKDPTSISGYTKFGNGSTKLRILSSPVMGWEYWEEKDGKRVPTRVREYKDVPEESRYGEYERKAFFFWALKVWNYGEKKAQLLEVKQSTIRKAIEAYAKNEEWGNPRNYDITITRSGEGKEISYAVIPSVPSEFDTTDKYIEDIDLGVWMDGGNPFGSAEKEEEQVEQEEQEEQEIEDTEPISNELLDEIVDATS